MINDPLDPQRVSHRLADFLMALILAIADGHEKADGLDAGRHFANRMRLVLHAAAYWLMLTVRDAIPSENQLAKAEFTTIRTNLIKIGFAAACHTIPPTRQVPRAGRPLIFGPKRPDKTSNLAIFTNIDTPTMPSSIAGQQAARSAQAILF